MKAFARKADYRPQFGTAAAEASAPRLDILASQTDDPAGRGRGGENENHPATPEDAYMKVHEDWGSIPHGSTNMKRIPLTNGGHTLVDRCDYAYLMQWNWYAKKHRHTRVQYAVRTFDGRRMHCLIASRMRLPAAARIDHANGDGLNNRRRNLRVATTSQNGANRGPTRQNTSGFKGVSWHKPTQQWLARIVVKGQQIWLGLHPDRKIAARAYNKAAQKHFGKFAVLNKA